MISVCTLPPGGWIGVQLTHGGGRVFRAGDRIDLDAEAAPGVTWRAALGSHVAAFVLEAVEKRERRPVGRDQE